MTKNTNLFKKFFKIRSRQEAETDILFKAQEILQKKADSSDLPFIKEVFADGVRGIRKALGGFPPTPELVEKLGWD